MRNFSNGPCITGRSGRYPHPADTRSAVRTPLRASDGPRAPVSWPHSWGFTRAGCAFISSVWRRPDRSLASGVSEPRGRPRDSWSVAADALPGGEPPDAYRQLARWLARSTPPRPGRLREIEQAGRELG